jgi:GNAT superfamily N-acetyltransferase
MGLSLYFYVKKYKKFLNIHMEIFKMIPTLISSDDKNMKKLIQKQGERVCRNEISQDILSNAIQKFDYGFAFVIERAQIGQNRLRIENRLKVSGFALMEEIDKNELHLHLICVETEHKGDGSILINHVIQYAKDNDYLIISLNALPEKKLVTWYELHGFRVYLPIYKGEELKVYKMILTLSL